MRPGRLRALLPGPPRGGGAPAYRLASALSYGINPLVLPPLAFVLVQAHLGAASPELARTFAIGTVFFALVPLGYVVRMVWRGEAETIELRRRERRLKPLGVGMASSALGAALLGQTAQTAPLLLACLAATFPLNTFLVLVVTRYWKISIHLVGLGGFLAFLLFAAWAAPGASLLTGPRVLALAPLVPLLAWARVRVGAHTPLQTAAGATLGLALPLAELYAAYRVLGPAALGLG
ncbi:MAG: hypothetical protein ACK41D_05020 [Rubricoccaceae bacterium]